MRRSTYSALRLAPLALAALVAAPARAQTPAPGAPSPNAPAAPDPVRALVARLDLGRYKATVKGLTQFGDRRQGTDRNRAALDWIEAQLKSYGCTNTERLTYAFQPRAPRPGADTAYHPRVATTAPGGARLRGAQLPIGVNSDSSAQPEARLRTLNAQPSAAGPRQEVWCTKVGAGHPGEMYIVGAHMDGIGWGEAANDDGSGTALVMELARVLSAPDVVTDRSIRFVLWNNEETGLDGARAYVAQRQALQGQESPAGSGRYPEPRWLGMIQHDMMLFDHGAPRADGTMGREQRAEADVNVEYQSRSKMAQPSQQLAWAVADANEAYATDYPATVGQHMTNTDSGPFQDVCPAISLRENERGAQIGAGWDPQWHQPSDVFATYTDKDFRLGLNAAQSTLGAVGRLAGATVRTR